MLSERYDAALAFASALHRSQTRKGSGIPYIAHLLSVSALVIEAGGDEDQAIAALLHDAVEDQGGLPTLARIEAEFGAPVARIVADCTDADTIPKPPWRQRKEAYLAALPRKPEASLLVALADKVHNARAIIADKARQGDAAFDRFRGGRDGTIWYYRSCAAAFLGRIADGRPGADLSRELERLAEEMGR